MHVFLFYHMCSVTSLGSSCGHAFILINDDFRKQVLQNNVRPSKIEWQDINQKNYIENIILFHVRHLD